MVELKDIIDHWLDDHNIERSAWTHVWYNNDVEFTCRVNNRLILLYGNEIQILKSYNEYEITKSTTISVYDNRMFNKLKEALEF